MQAQRHQLWWALVSLAVGALILHYKFHPPHKLTEFWATFFSGLDLVLVSALFLSRATAVWGLLLNSFLAYFGIIMMADVAVVGVFRGWLKVSFLQDPITWISNSMLPYIAIVFADFLVGLALYEIIIKQRTARAS
jgi:hypothetical protein